MLEIHNSVKLKVVYEKSYRRNDSVVLPKNEEPL